jgi:LEA14-like dessication related protein
MSKSTRIIILISIAIACAGIAAWLLFLKNPQKNPVSNNLPQVELVLGKISSITDSTVDLSLRALVNNPLPVGLKIAHLKYKVAINGKTIIEDRHDTPVSINGNDSSVVTLASKLKIRALDQQGDQLAAMGIDSADYQFQAVIFPQKPILGKDSLSFSVNKRLPLYRLPEIELADFDLKNLKLKDTDVVIRLRVKNRNAFSIRFQDPVYSMDLGKQKQFAGGKVAGVTRVNAGSEEVFTIPLSVRLGKALRATAQLLTKGKHLPYKFHFKSKIISDNQVINNCELRLVIDGKLQDLESAKKNLGKD